MTVTRTAPEVTIPAELTAWALRLRAVAVLGILGLVIGGRELARLPIALGPVFAIAIGALAYNAILAAVLWRAKQVRAPGGDRIRAYVLYAGGLLDTVAISLGVLATGGHVSPWLYFFLASSLVAATILPPSAGRVLIIVNACAAMVVIFASARGGWLAPVAWSGLQLETSPSFAGIVGLSLISLMCVTAYAVSVPVENARAATRFQEGLAQIALTLQRSGGGKDALATVCGHANDWFGVDRTQIALLEGEDLVVQAAEGPGAPSLLGRRTRLKDIESLEGEVWRRRTGFFVNDLRHSAYARNPLVAELGDRAVLLVPLVGTSGLLGVLSMADRRQANRFTPTLLQRASILGAQTGVAVENARLLARVREEADRVTALLSALERLTKTYELPTLLAELNHIGADMAGGDRSATFLWEPRREVFYFGSSFSNSPAPFEPMYRFEFPRGSVALIERVLAGETVVLSPDEGRALAPIALEHSVRVGATAVIPLIAEDAVQGVMTVSYADRRRAFTTEHLWMLRGIAHYAALAIERARLIAQEREAAKTAEALVRDLRQANRLKSDFLSTVSHELRTPLNAIMGYTDLLRERAMGPLEPEQAHALDVIGKKSIQLLELINTTLDVTRLESGQMDIDVSEFALPELLAEVHENLADEVPPRVELRWHGAPQLPAMSTDRMKLKTVLKNLVHNALKFTREGHVELRAEAAATPGHVDLVVADTGIGIADEDVRAIFEMFRQLEPAMTRRFGGVGLGLYIVRRLLDLIGGTIHVESRLGSGSTFTVTVPVRYQRPGAQSWPAEAGLTTR